MLANLAKRIFGSRNDRLLKQYQAKVAQINALEPALEQLTDEQLKSKTAVFKARHQAGESLDSLLVEAFAVAREAGRRFLGMRHFDSQLIGAMVLHEGKISEMSTGEGKTLVATLAIYLNALSAKSVHLVTVNEYLVKRDAAWMSPLYTGLGLTVGVIVPGQKRAEKRLAYACDIVYATNNELGFDYLRDRMAQSEEDWVQGLLAYAIVDEVDSILIDEARTPLIISGPSDDSSLLYLKINDLIPLLTLQLSEDQPGDYCLDEKSKQAFLTESGHQRIEELFLEKGLLPAGQSLYGPQSMILMHHVTAALRAHALFKCDVDYIVTNQEVVIVDEHTGRTMPGRRWSDGLHQAVEAKEGVPIQNENQTLASITFQNFFRLYGKLAGMTGTADTEAFEFQQIYGLEVVVIPTNRPCQRIDLSDMVYLTQAEKFENILSDIRACMDQKRPVLVGTIAIETSEFLSGLLKKKGIPHKVLNAKYHEQEALIVEQAGRPGAVTIATNMAGRGTDIVLGGCLSAELKAIPEEEGERRAQVKADWQARHDAVVAVGGLHIIGTERHESRRIDNQLRGRCARQGDPGSSRFYLSLEDALMRIFASDKMQNLMRKLGVKQGEAIEHPWINKAIANAQRKVEGYHFDIRKQLLQFDNVANDQRTVIYTQRDAIVVSEDLSESVQELRREVVTAVLEEYLPTEQMVDLWNIDECEQRFLAEFNVVAPIAAWLKEDVHLTQEGIHDKIIGLMESNYQAKQAIVEAAGFRRLEKAVMLQLLDIHWKEHLAALDYLRQSIHLRGYAQKDPKQEYKREAFNLFTNMLDNIKRDLIGTLSRLEIQAQALPTPAASGEERRLNYQHADAAVIAQEQAEILPISTEAQKVGRNEPCPCGSGKKFKQCHGMLVS